MKIEKLLKLLSQEQNIIIMGHRTPDVDTLFASYIMKNILKTYNIESDFAIIENEKLDDMSQKISKYIFKHTPKIIKEKDIPKYKYFLVDHNDPKQSVNNKNLIIGGIDHHPDSNNLNNIILGKYASTCLQIYDIFKNKYSFNKEEKNLIYYATMRDSYFGKSIRYQEKDKKIIKSLGYDETFKGLLEKFFINTDLTNKEEAFNTNGLKNYEFNDIKFKSTYITAFDTNNLKEYQNFVKNNKENFLGIYIDIKNEHSYICLNYNQEFITKEYDFIVSRGSMIIPEVLKYIRGEHE